MQNLRDQQAELSVTKNSNTRPIRNDRLIEDLARCRNRLHKHGRFVGDSVGYDVQIGFRECQKFPEGTRMPKDAKNIPRRTVTPKTSLTPFALSARNVDLTHYSASNQSCRISRHNLTHEFVARRARKSVVAALEFEVRVANAPKNQAD
jgi:hypothetical protein